MKKHFRFIFLLMLLLGLNASTASAQNSFASEEELKTQAAKLFDEDQFEEAYPLYSQLVSLYQKDVNYNFRLGVCMLYASDDKEKPIAFLEFAAKSPEAEKEVQFYLARAYHLNYRFDDAIKKYNDYKKVASAAKAEKLMVDRQIEMCKNGKKLLRNITDLVVIDKKEMSRQEFYRSYDISDIGGKLLVKPDEPAFKTSVDKKKKENSVIYLATNNNQVFFSSYGDNTERGKDIFVIRKLPNGEWSLPQTLGYPVNTEYDEDYPFLHPNGKVLYFCSKGHSSMGGYDIFKTTLNEETNTWNKPVNMDFPINTPDDDILYVTNEDEKEAFFSSARNSVTGKTAVFHINVERKPIDVAIIKGAMVANRDGQALDARITVKDLGDNSILGIYNAKENGGYLINLPNGGKFLFTVETSGFATQSDVVVMPTQYEFKPLKQEISYELGTDKLIIKNLFDEPVDDANYLAVIKVLKEKSKMEVSSAQEIADAKTAAANTNNNQSNETANTNAQEENVANNKTQPTNLSNEEIVKIAYNDAKDVETEAKEFKEQADIALSIANQKNEIAQNKLKEADQLKADANMMTDNAKKQATMEEANAAYRDAEELNQETVAAFNLAKRLDQTAAAKQKEADLSLEYAKNIETAVKSKNATEALAKLEEQQKQLDALNAENTASANIVNSIKLDAENKKKELDKATQELSDIKQEIADNETLIANTQADIAKTKNEQIKADLQNQIEGLKADNEMSKKDIVVAEEKVNKLQKEYNGILNEVAMVSNVVNQSKTTTSESAAATVASIDKNKLEQQVNTIKSNPSVSNEVAVNNKTTYSNETNNAVVTNNKTQEENANTNAVTNNNTTENTNANTSEVAANNNAANNEGITETPAVAKVDLAAKYNEELQSAEAISNPVERENKKAALYNDWVADMNKEIAALKQEQKTTSDKEKKKEISASIASLEKEVKVKQQTAKETLATAKKLEKEQGAVAANNTATNETNTNNTNETNSGNENAAATTENTTAATNKSNQDYAQELFAAQNISNEADREKAKADVLNNWVASINADIDKKKADMKASSDPEMKALLAQKVIDLQKQRDEKQTQANESLARVEALKGNAVAANNTTAGNTSATENTAANTQNESVTNTNKTANETTNSNEVAANTNNATENNNNKTVNNTTATETNNAANSQVASNENNSGNTNTTSNNEVDANVNNTNNATNANAQENTNAGVANNNTNANNSTAANNQTGNTNNETAVGNQNTNNNTTTEVAANKTTATSTQNTGDGNEEEPVATNTTNNSKQFSFSSQAAADQSAKAATINTQADLLVDQANELKQQANASTDPAVRTELFEKANEMEQQAREKRMQAVIISASANKAEFENNKTNLEQLSKLSAQKNGDDLLMADMLKDEAIVYYNKAQLNREEAAAAPEYYAKETLSEEAYRNEMMALDKQKKATEIYMKYNPQYVATNAATNTSNSELASNTQSNKWVTGNGANNGQQNNETAATANNGNGNNKQVSPNTSENTAVENNNTVANNTTQNNEGANNTTAAQTNNTATTNTTNDQAVNNNNTANNTNNTNNTTAAQNTANNATESTSAVTNNETNPVGNNNTTNTTSAGNNTASNTSVQLSPEEKFERTTVPVYNASKPIPVNEKLPEGLIFKVQIGAFRNPIPQDLFKGMTPITGETTPTGLTRYTAGLFKKFSTADKVKQEIRDLGYRDAFVVAFYNGKRISMSEALAMTGEPMPVAANTTTADQTNAANNTQTTAQNTAATTNNTAANQNNTTTQNQQTVASESIATVTGLFYTVQVGVFSQPVSANKLNIQPLYTERAPNGNIRYNTGVYNNIARAAEAKNIVIGEGIKDAFVTAYVDGKRISLTEAQALVAAQGNAVFSTAPNMNQLPVVGPVSASQPAPRAPQPSPVNTTPVVSNTVATTPANTTTTATTPSVANTTPNNNGIAVSGETIQPLDENKLPPSVQDEKGVIFKVQIGAFNEDVPLPIANKFLRIAKMGVKNFEDEQGRTVYTVGVYANYEDAAKAKALVVEQGITDAFIIAFSDGKKISIDEAKQLLTK
ncbi:MAG: PD40 domain-containing protein [Bacteroidetes bacterium]|nr:PD40 domain-containing protein [Bacteroidota bacterium]